MSSTVKQSEARRIANKSKRTFIKNLIKKVQSAATKDEAITQFKILEKSIMQASGKGVLHINTAARKLSRTYSAIKSKFA